MVVNSKDISDDDILTALQAKYDFYIYLSKFNLEAANKIKSTIDVLSTTIDDKKIELVKDVNIKPKVKAVIQADVFDSDVASISKRVFQDIIVDILSDGIPRTTKQLYEHYKLLDRKDLLLKDFSSKLSVRAKSGGAKIKNVKFQKYPPDERYWWCLASWFKGDDMNEEFIIRIQKKMGY